MSTTLPHGIIQINEGNISWYGDITANWQLIDSKIGVYDAAIATIPAPANNGTLTINYGGTTIAMFGADDSGNVTADIPAPGDGTLTVTQGGSTLGTFTANQAAAGTIDIPAPGDGTLTIQLNGVDVQTFTANQSGNATANIVTPAINNGTLTIRLNGVDVQTFTANQANDVVADIIPPVPGDGTLTIKVNGATAGTFTANQSTAATANITVPTKTSDLTNDSGFITSDDTKIPLAGSNAISGSLIPTTDNSIDIGSSTKNLKMLYTKGITIDGTQFLPSDYIPKSGGAVMTGGSLGRTEHYDALKICGGVDSTDGGFITVCGKNYASFEGHVFITANDGTNQNQIQIKPNGDTRLINCKVFYPSTDNTTSSAAPSYRWSVVYAATGTINTSDSRFKNNIKDIDNKLLDAWENIEPKQYKFNDATEKKGKKARYHTGYLAQDIQAECEKQGVNASDYGLFCYDEWEEQEEESEEIETEKDGKIVKEKRVIQPKREKGNMYALRYEEALVVECKYLRRCIARLTARIEELEKGKEQEAGK